MPVTPLAFTNPVYVTRHREPPPRFRAPLGSRPQRPKPVKLQRITRSPRQAAVPIAVRREKCASLALLQWGWEGPLAGQRRSWYFLSLCQLWLSTSSGRPREPTLLNVAFGRYRLLERLGKGGMAEVFKAKSFGVEGFEKVLVIKRILPELARSPEFVRMFIHEAKLAVRLSHANIVQVFDLGWLKVWRATACSSRIPITSRWSTCTASTCRHFLRAAAETT